MLRQLLKPFYSLYKQKYIAPIEVQAKKQQIKLHSDVSDIMTARIDILALEEKTPFKDVMKIIAQTGFSRIPVYRNELDNIFGVLHVKDLFKYFSEGKPFEWQKIIREPFFVPEVKKTSLLLKEFLQEKRHQAIVVDEFGSVTGIVSLEDIIEEIVGEINDEFDVKKEALYTQFDNHTYIFNAKISINDFCKAINVKEDFFDSVSGQADTLAGMLIEMTDHLPQKQETIKYKQYFFVIEKADKRKIEQVKLIIK
jgi:Hemolysins and related proteins containing CBS domains